MAAQSISNSLNKSQIQLDMISEESKSSVKIVPDEYNQEIKPEIYDPIR